MTEQSRKPQISVIMPVYNTKEEYFREAIESILRQTFKNFELLIVDDCSKPYIADIVKSYSDQRIKYFRLKENSGAAETRNFALKKAMSPYIAFMDSDDISYPERLQKQYDYLEKHPEIGCLGTKVEIVGDSAFNMCFPKPTNHKDIELWLLFDGCVFCQSSVMVRKEILDKNKIQYNSYYVPTEDYALWLDLVGLTKFAVLDECLGKYRFYSENISNRQKDKQIKKGNEARIKAIIKYLSVHDLNENIWDRFLQEQNLTIEEIKHINYILPKVYNKLLSKTYSSQEIGKLFKNHFRKLFLHTHTLYGHFLLIKSPLNKYFNIPLRWRLFCFITRGIF
ncbi:MAG: glycosyltransferase family 2 protein [Alphaproteobacteria bacterium]|nr:glycosyltransferase family 2 protein [Alphaproteobacteria bacterium]